MSNGRASSRMKKESLEERTSPQGFVDRLKTVVSHLVRPEIARTVELSKDTGYSCTMFVHDPKAEKYVVMQLKNRGYEMKVGAMGRGRYLVYAPKGVSESVDPVMNSSAFELLRGMGIESTDTFRSAGGRSLWQQGQDEEAGLGEEDLEEPREEDDGELRVSREDDNEISAFESLAKMASATIGRPTVDDPQLGMDPPATRSIPDEDA